MTRTQKCLAAFLLFFLQLGSVASLAQSNFVGVPESCAKTLAELGNDSKLTAINAHVNWSEIRKNMIALGYPDRIVTQKLESMPWSPEEALAQIRASAPPPNWNWGDSITRPMLQSLVTSPMASHIYSSLPVWDSLNRFETPFLIHEALSNSALNEESLKSLAQFAPSWLKGELALENAKLFLGKSTPIDQLGSAHWILANLTDVDRNEITRQLLEQVKAIPLSDEKPSSSAEPALGLVTTLPWKEMPGSVSQHLTENWVDLQNYPAETMDSVRYVRYGVQSAGCCEYMTFGHLTTLGLAQ